MRGFFPTPQLARYCIDTYSVVFVARSFNKIAS